MSGVWLVLPTYNEAENIELFLAAVLDQLGPDDHALVVDDNSPDGTGRLADEYALHEPRLEVLHRELKEGLRKAYIAGFHHALAAGAEYVMEMDSDFSHDPKDIPRLLAAAAGADLVLGSRYVPGGGVTDWGLLRQAISRGGSWYARRILGVPIRDLTGGFKCFRREVLEMIDIDNVHADGYGFQIELTYRAIKAGFLVVEVPIVFRDRRAGQSKMHARIALEAVWKVPALRRRTPPLISKQN